MILGNISIPHPVWPSIGSVAAPSTDLHPTTTKRRDSALCLILLPSVETHLFWYLMLVRTSRLFVFYSIVFACLFILNSVLFFSRHFGIWLGIQSDCYLAYKYIFTLRSLWTLLGVCININFLASILFWFLMFLKRVELFGLLINLMFYDFIFN